jgi:hypothetical protein
LLNSELALASSLLKQCVLNSVIVSVSHKMEAVVEPFLARFGRKVGVAIFGAK